jgi:hypothetical protein
MVLASARLPSAANKRTQRMHGVRSEGDDMNLRARRKQREPRIVPRACAASIGANLHAADRPLRN